MLSENIALKRITYLLVDQMDLYVIIVCMHYRISAFVTLSLMKNFCKVLNATANLLSDEEFKLDGSEQSDVFAVLESVFSFFFHF